MFKNNNKQNWTKNVGGIIVTLLCLLIIVYQVDLGEVLEALKQFQWQYLTLAVASLAVGYVSRIYRWSIMLRSTGAAATWQLCAAPFLGSISLNNVLPLRLGDVIRALVFPAAMGISKTTGASSLLMERLIDLMTLLVCLAIGLVLVQGARLTPLMSETIIVLAIAGGLILIIVFLFSGALSKFFHRFAKSAIRQETRGRLVHLLEVASNLFHDFEAMSRASVLFSVIIISMLVWTGESGLFYFLLLGFGFDTSPALAVFVMSIATLSTLVPSSPGYVGPFHLATFTVMTMLGGTSAQAGSFALLAHLALWLPTTLAGAIAIWMNPVLFRSIRSKPNLKS